MSESNRAFSFDVYDAGYEMNGNYEVWKASLVNKHPCNNKHL